jgi:predicted phage terminase large subunit-like protein
MTGVLPGLPGAPDLTAAEKAAVVAHAYRTEFEFFGRRALADILPTFEDNWHIDALFNIGSRIAYGELKRGIVNVAPRGLKSVIFSEILPAFVLGQNPAAKIICVSYSQDAADHFALTTRQIMRQPWYRRLFPKTKLSSAAVANLRTTAGGYRMATSVGGAVTGFGADLIILDDPVKADDAYSETVRNGANDWVRSSLMSRFNDRRTGQMLVVVQRLHQHDVVGMLEETGDWETLSLPVIATETRTYDLGRGRSYTRPIGELLHRTRDTPEGLESTRRQLGSRNFEAQYQQQPTPPDGSVFKRKWLREYPTPYIPKAGDRIIQSWDMANKTGDGNDWSVCITAALRRSEVILIDVFRDRLAFPELKKKVVALALQYGPMKLLIEDAAAGTQMIQTLQADQPKGVPLPIAIKADRDKYSRADRAAARVEAGALVMPDSAPWRESLVGELLGFPAARHDDQVDALVQLMIHTEGEAMPRLDAALLAGSETDVDLRNEMLSDRCAPQDWED